VGKNEYTIIIFCEIINERSWKYLGNKRVIKFFIFGIIFRNSDEQKRRAYKICVEI